MSAHLGRPALALTLLTALSACEEEASSRFGATSNLPAVCGETTSCAEGFDCLMLPDSDFGFCTCAGVPNCAEGECVCEDPQIHGPGEPCSSDANCQEGLSCKANDAVGTLACR